ncbi:MAG: peptidase M75 [Candidatus Latescibacteria bacterium]|nr:peptidase M75 [Candidatus Latescibacterota bacterium]
MKHITLSIILAFSLAACSSDDNPVAPEPEPDSGYDFSPILTDFSDKTVIPTYKDLANVATELLTAVQNLKTNPSAATLATARAKWVASRTPWEKSEGFLFGPVDFSGFDPALDSWPVNRTDLEGVLGSSDPLTKTSVNNLANELKGFHTIEFLLFDEGGSKTIEDFTPRQYDYLIAATELLKDAAVSLHTSWIASGENFRAQVVNAGAGSSTYTTQKAAVQEMVNGMIGIADEVGNGKIADPFTEQDTRLVESQFSFNSLLDFQDNMRSIQNVYLGGYNVEAAGLDEFVKSKDSALDQRFQAEIQAAITEIGKISFPFRDALATDAAQITAAQQAIATVQQTLEGDIMSLVLAEQ